MYQEIRTAGLHRDDRYQEYAARLTEELPPDRVYACVEHVVGYESASIRGNSSDCRATISVNGTESIAMVRDALSIVLAMESPAETLGRIVRQWQEYTPHGSSSHQVRLFLTGGRASFADLQLLAAVARHEFAALHDADISVRVYRGGNMDRTTGIEFPADRSVIPASYQPTATFECTYA